MMNRASEDTVADDDIAEETRLAGNVPLSWRCIACQTRTPASLLYRERYHYGRADGSAGEWKYAVIRCDRCGQGRLDPLPSAGLLSAFYSADFHTYRETKRGLQWRASRVIKNAMGRIAAQSLRHDDSSFRLKFTESVESTLSFLGARRVPFTTSVALGLPRDTSILDYGCGGGWWLKELKRIGYDHLWGFDVENPCLDDLAAEGIQIVRDGKGKLPEATFSLIRLEHVLEHVVDPIAILAALKSCLLPAGEIVLTVPNFGSWSSRTLGDRWASLSLPFHLTHFSAKSLAAVANEAGFEVIDLRYLPIWEQALPALSKGPGGPLRAKILGFSLVRPFAKTAYYGWAMRRDEGDYLSARLRVRAR